MLVPVQFTHCAPHSLGRHLPATALVSPQAGHTTLGTMRALAPSPARLAPPPPSRPARPSRQSRLVAAAEPRDYESLRALLASSAAQLTPLEAAAAAQRLAAADTASRRAALEAEERRLATLEAELMGAERGLVAQPAAVAAKPPGVASGRGALRQRLEGSEAEAAVRGPARRLGAGGLWARLA